MLPEEDQSDIADDFTEKTILAIFSTTASISDDQVGEISKIIASVEIDSFLLTEDLDTSSETLKALKIEPALKELSSFSEAPEDIRHIILKAKLPQKVKLALLGNATCRGLLIRDSNKIIQQCVLKNPRLQASEVEEFSKNSNLSDFVLRSIGSNSQWMRSYSLKCAITFNPKTPQDVSIKWVKFLNTADLRKLAKSKNVPSVISVTARKRLADMEEK